MERQQHAAAPPDAGRAAIIINNHNYGRFLAEAIDSALSQTYAKTEVIVVDDGSTDNSREVAKRFFHRAVVMFKENCGQASAYNAGFAASQSDYVCFLDADDLLEPTTIADSVEAFRDPQLVKVEWQLKIIDARGRCTGGVVPERPLPAADLRNCTLSEGPFYDWLITPPGSGNCYRSAMLHQVMPMPEQSFRHGADVYLTMLAPIFGRIHRLPEPSGQYRVHGNNNYFGRTLDSSRLLDYIHRFDDCCSQLKRHLRAQGIDADVDAWKRCNFNYVWPTRLLQAKSEIESAVPLGASYLIVNDDEWGEGEPAEGRRAIPFLGRGDEFWGTSSDDEVVLAQLDRHRRQGASHLVFWWTCFWWLDHFPIFKQHLYSQFPCVLENDRLLVFELEKQITSAGVSI